MDFILFSFIKLIFSFSAVRPSIHPSIHPSPLLEMKSCESNSRALAHQLIRQFPFVVRDIGARNTSLKTVQLNVSVLPFFFFLVLSTLNDFALEIEHQSMSFCAANNVVEFVFNSFFFKVILKLFFHFQWFCTENIISI